MARLRVHNFAISIDGYAAGPRQTLERPLGEGGSGLHEWVFATPYGRRMIGQEVPDTGGADAQGTEVGDDVDDAFLTRGDVGIGATIMGRNMFGPVRGPWPDYDWTGWWGDEPPYHHPVFVLTHHVRPPLEMVGTTFHFVTEGPEAAYEQAMEAAEGADVRVGGGAATVQQYLRLGLVDEMHIAIVPVLLGSGERLFDGLGAAPPPYECVELVSSPAVVHARFVRTRD